MDFNTKKHFDEIAISYQGQLLKDRSFFDLKKEFIDEYKVKKAWDLNKSAKKILDYGCGVGFLQKYIYKYFLSAKVFATDLSSNSLKILKKKILKHSFFMIYQRLKIKSLILYFYPV